MSKPKRNQTRADYDARRSAELQKKLLKGTITEAEKRDLNQIHFGGVGGTA